MSSPTGNLMFQELSQAEDAGKASAISPSPEPGPSRRKPASRFQKSVASITGATAVSFIITPLDVIKTRLQTQAAPEPLFQPSSHLPSAAKGKAPATNAATCCQQTFFTGGVNEESLTCKYDPRVAGSQQTGPSGEARTTSSSTYRARSSPATHPQHPRAPFAHTTAFSHPSGSGAAAATMRLHPSSTCAFPNQSVAAMELGALGSQNRMNGILDGVTKVARAEGIRGLFRGLSPTLMMAVPSQVTYMGCYDVFRAFFLSFETPVKRPPSAISNAAAASNITSQTVLTSLVAGALSRGCSATLVTPLELIRTRLQASDASHSLTSIVRSLGTQVRQEGSHVLFRGLASTLWRDVPFSAIYFMGYEMMKRSMTGGAGLGEGELKGGLEEFGIAFVSGATSGSVAAVFTQPFDLLKTRQQARQQEHSSSSSAVTRGSRTMQGLKTIVAEEGWKGLFRGLSPRMAKVAPACGIMIGSYEAVGTLFAMAGSE
ncbi:mitochondrial carrier [Jaminaea rosea]|uniref:Mitochondrial carrier n=1 Tax=Jaminaea rosea TaxID=1569628 RepID=A0A316UWB9_9BASI|nr:mitochondrial carrier [Jaminaea rosea]PWN27415.1 mitochondrial carrier [Jaminaea rosea]